MKIKVLGTGCAKCKKQYDEAVKAVAETGVAAEVEKVEDIDEILGFGVMMTPALVIDEQVVISGRVAPCKDVAALIAKTAGK